MLRVVSEVYSSLLYHVCSLMSVQRESILAKLHSAISLFYIYILPINPFFSNPNLFPPSSSPTSLCIPPIPKDL